MSCSASRSASCRSVFYCQSCHRLSRGFPLVIPCQKSGPPPARRPGRSHNPKRARRDSAHIAATAFERRRHPIPQRGQHVSHVTAPMPNQFLTRENTDGRHRLAPARGLHVEPFQPLRRSAGQLGDAIVPRLGCVKKQDRLSRPADGLDLGETRDHRPCLVGQRQPLQAIPSQQGIDPVRQIGRNSDRFLQRARTGSVSGPAVPSRLLP